jgi:hypothetical protein
MGKNEKRIFDPNHHYFPEIDNPAIIAFLIPFGRLMFGYANLDREIVGIVRAATGKNDFVRRDASNVSNQVEKFIVKHAGRIAEMKAIKEQLDRTVRLYHLRNDLAHGHSEEVHGLGAPRGRRSRCSP